MALLTKPTSAPALGRDLLERIEVLGLTLLRLESSGRSRVLIGGGDVATSLLASNLFIDAVRRSWESFCAGHGSVAEVLPGVFLTALIDPQQRRRVNTPPPTRLHTVLMLGRPFVASDHFRMICDQAELDAEATGRLLDTGQLVEPSEAGRIALTLGWMCEDVASLDRRSGELQGLSLELADTYEELSLLYKLATSLRVNQSPKNTLVEACDDLQQVVGFSWMGLALGGDPRLEELANELLVSDAGVVNRAQLTAAAAALKQRFADTDGPVIIDNTRELGLFEVEAIGNNILIVPMKIEDRLLGILFGGDRIDGSLLSSVDAKLCESLAASLTIFLDNRMLYEDAQSMFLGTLHALTAAIDAKDSYTHGHSERVALLARMLAEASGFAPDTRERVYLSGLVHDVGKIGVPEEVLCKPGRLTEEEFGYIKLHPEIGANILKDIPQMQDLVPGVLYHHEKYDGGGYPHGLAGEEIPLFGRLIGLADAFDAMSSKRTYRNAMKLEAVLQEIRDCSGSQFHPELAAAFVEMDFQPYYDLIAKHQRQQKPV